MKRRGFTLIELLLTLGGTAVVIGGMMAFLYILFSASAASSVSHTSAYGKNEYMSVPSPRALVRAVRLLDEFQMIQGAASATFVLGGFRETPGNSASEGQAAPLAAGYLFPSAGSFATATIALNSQALPQTATDFRAAIAGRTGISFEGTYTPSDFTIITVSGLQTISSVLQVRRFTTTADGSVNLYEVVFDKNLSDPRNEVDGDPGQNRFAYRMAIPTADDRWQIAPGALNYWFRWDAVWNRREQGPTLVVFPDPYLLAGQQGDGDTVPFSRFTFFLSPSS